MVPYVIRYKFSQHFAVSASAAFDWCTDYQPSDHALIGNSDAKRVITKVADGVVIVKDAFQTADGAVVKEKIVYLYPNQLRWTSTHLSSPNRHSQFTYQITAETDGTSWLEFIALHVEHTENLSEKEQKSLAEELCASDAETWRRFAAAMKKELTA